MNEGKELIKALDDIEKEKGISKDILLEAIENSLVAACKNEYGKADNIRVTMNRETGEVKVFADKTVVEEVEDPEMEISVADARLKNKFYDSGDIVHVEIVPKNFGRIAAQKAKQVVVQKIREEERKSLYNEYYGREKDIVTGVVQRYNGKNISVNLGKVDAVLTENEQVKGEVFKPTDRIKLYIGIDVTFLVDDKQGLKIPNTSIVEKEFYLIPKDYAIVNEENNSKSFLKEVYSDDGTAGAESLNMTIYYEDDDYYYLDPMETDYTTGELKLTAGTYLLKEDSSDKFAVGQKGSLQGVYNINKGYTQFRQISILAQNEEYTLVEEGTSYGLTVYDRIVLNGSTVSEDQIIQ